MESGETLRPSGRRHPNQEPPWLSRALKPITQVKPGEATTALLLTLNAFCLLAAYYLVKPVRESLILMLASGAEYKSYLGAAIAVALLFVVPAYAHAVDRLSRRKLVVNVSLFFALHLVLFFLASSSPTLRPRMGLVFFVWVGVFNMMVVAQLWAFAADVYSEEQGKRLFPLIALGAALGAAFGSRLAATLIPFTGVTSLLLGAAFALVLCALLFRVIDARLEGQKPAKERPKASAVPTGAFHLVAKVPYLRWVAAFSLVFSAVNTNGEYMLGKLVKLAASDAVARGALPAESVGEYVGATYAEFFFYVNVVGLLLQTFVVSRLVRWFDFGPSFLLFPLLAFVDASVAAALPILAVVRVGKVLENATDYSLNNTLRQMLWLPTTREIKYKAKQAVDTFFVRMGDVTSAVVVWASTALGASGVRGIALVNVLLVLIWLGLALAIAIEARKGEVGASNSASTLGVN